MLLFDKESSGVPDRVHEADDDRRTITMVDWLRSLNLACSVSMVIGGAMRQLGDIKTQPD